MRLLEPGELYNEEKYKRLGGQSAAKFLMLLLRADRVNKVYNKHLDKFDSDFIDAFLDDLEIKFNVEGTDLKKIPKTGPFVVVANHPFGGIDGLLLLKIIRSVRPDFKVFPNFLVGKINQVSGCLIKPNPFDSSNTDTKHSRGLAIAREWVNNGGGIGVFPAGEVSSFANSHNGVSDKLWDQQAIKFIKELKMPIVPVHFQGSNSKMYQVLGVIHAKLAAAKLPSEFLNKKNKVINVRVGNVISVKDQSQISDTSRFGRFLRAKNYALGSALEVQKYFKAGITKAEKIEKIIDPVDPVIIQKEVEKLTNDYLLFNSDNYAVICAPAFEMPNILTELGRLREETFRAVGEGTNRSIDVDEFDLYFNQLFIWDTEKNKIVGAYRVGKGKEIISEYGKKGFYIESLFKIKKPFISVLEKSLELGRSFIVQDYQRKPLPLFLLWKGILYFLLKNPEYRYLVGPVSISNDFSTVSKSIIIKFMKTYYYDNKLANYIAPRTKFKVNQTALEEEMLFDHSNDIGELDKIITDIEIKGYRMPVLLKKYIKLGGKIVGFNVDPLFNNALDGLLILDVFNVPMNVIASLSKEINDKSILERFETQE
ncbi:MAG: lysophospholipid acyltransferase family protein [Bacteroidales bacterium]|nr:lysophospholipid acyltransferase family protein [Bacteroidales bacterium]